MLRQKIIPRKKHITLLKTNSKFALGKKTDGWKLEDEFVSFWGILAYFQV